MKHLRWVALFFVACWPAFAAEMKLSPPPERYTRHDYLDQRIEMKPLFDTPLRHTFILRGPDNVYYLTGTVSTGDKGTDFQNNDGIFLWKSVDLKVWQPLGQAWSIEKQGRAWQKEYRLNPDQPAGPLARGMTAPEIHFLKGTWWIAYSLNGQGTGLLKSRTGQPEGPYADIGRITAAEGDPSLFEDFDGTIYWVWGPGRLARMTDDLSGLAESPRQLTWGFPLPQKVGGAQPHQVLNVSLYKTTLSDKKPRYHAVFESGHCRLGGDTRDTFIASADQLFGPYGALPFDGYGDAQMLIEHGGQANLFQDAAGNWYGTFYGADDHAVWRDRPGIVTTKWDKERARPSRHHYFKDFPTRGPWATIEPLFRDAQVNDQQILNAPDGHYYFTGSVWDNFRHGAATIWKSKTLAPRRAQPGNWEEIRVCAYTDIPALRRAAEQIPGLLDFTARRNPHISGVAWGTEIHYLKGNYWILYQILANNKIVQDEMKKDGGGMNPLFRSQTGQAEGPYEFVANLPASAASLFEDDDGSVYLLSGTTVFAKLKDDLTGIDEPFMERRRVEHGFNKLLENREKLNTDYDIGFSMVKIGGKYVIFTCNCIGGYDQQYWVAKNLWGPYNRPRVMMPHGGHSFVMKDKEGRWWSLQWSHTTGMVPCLHELYVEDTGDDIIIMPRWEYEYRVKTRPLTIGGQ